MRADTHGVGAGHRLRQALCRCADAGGDVMVDAGKLLRRENAHRREPRFRQLHGIARAPVILFLLAAVAEVAAEPAAGLVEMAVEHGLDDDRPSLSPR